MTGDHGDEARRLAGVTEADVLGWGGEARVYALDSDRVLKVWHRAADTSYPAMLGAWYDKLRAALGRVPFAVPQVLDVEVVDGAVCSIEARMPGRALDAAMRDLDGAARERALTSFGRTTAAVVAVPASAVGGAADGSWWGELFSSDPWPQLRMPTWSGFLDAGIDRHLGNASYLADDVAALDGLVDELRAAVASLLPAEPRLVHGDWYPGNVIIDGDEVSGVIDFGFLTLAGDPCFEAASAVLFTDIPPAARPSDVDVVADAVAGLLGPDPATMLRVARLWNALRFSPYRKDDEKLYQRCLAWLRAG